MRHLGIVCSLPVLLLSTSALAATKVGIVGAANPMLIAQGEGGIERELHTGDTVFMGEKLRTSETGSAQLMFLDRSALTISPNSTITIDTFVYDPATELGEMSMNAGVGAFRFIGGALSKKNPVSIKTPVSTIGIRGGVGDTFVGEQGQTQGVFHHGDAMSMTNANGVTTVTTDSGSGFSQETPTSTPTAMTQQQLTQSFTTTPVGLASNVVPSADPTSLGQLNNSLQSTVPPSPLPSAPTAAPTPTPQSQPQPQVNGAPEQTPSESPTAAPQDTTAAPEASTTATNDAPQNAETPAVQANTENPSDVAAPKPATDQPLSQSEVSELRENPKSLQEKFPDGGMKMTNYVARAVATDPTLADSLGGALDGATPAQVSAIGGGLARGGRLIAAQNPQALVDLNASVQSLNNPQLSRVFNAIGPSVPLIGVHPLPTTMPQSVVPSPNQGQKLEGAASRYSPKPTTDFSKMQNKNRKLTNPAQPTAQPTVQQTQAGGPVGVNSFGTILQNPSILPTVTSIVATEAVKNDTVSTSPTK